jgi:hypothetical protein
LFNDKPSGKKSYQHISRFSGDFYSAYAIGALALYIPFIIPSIPERPRNGGVIAEMLARSYTISAWGIYLYNADNTA